MYIGVTSNKAKHRPREMKISSRVLKSWKQWLTLLPAELDAVLEIKKTMEAIEIKNDHSFTLNELGRLSDLRSRWEKTVGVRMYVIDAAFAQKKIN